MTRRIALLVLFAFSGLIAPRVALGLDLIDRSKLAQLELQLYWHAELPIGNDIVRRVVALDDCVYVITQDNKVFAVHGPTGVLRWSTEVASPNQRLLGPTHSKSFAVFTTSTSIRLFDRVTGRLAGDPRKIRGFVIEARGDDADIDVGRFHGLDVGMTLGIFRGTTGDVGEKPLAHFRIVSIHDRESTGRFLDVNPTDRPRAGDRVFAQITLPIEELKVPFSPSSPAVSDGDNAYFGAANQRFYAMNVRLGVREWELLTPRTVTAEPVLFGDDLIIAGQDATVTRINAKDRTGVWPRPFRTEGPIFARPAVTPDRVFVASSDRSLYAIDAKSGRRKWRERFDHELLTAPTATGDAVYQYVPLQGLVVLDAEDGSTRWKAGGGANFLTQIGDTAYILAGLSEDNGTRISSAAIARYDAKSGDARGLEDAGACSFVVGTLNPPAIYACDRLGRLICARSASEPHLKPEALADAFRDEANVKSVAEVEKRMEAERKARQARLTGKKAKYDPFASKSTATPAAGPGLVPPTPSSAPSEETPTTTEASQPAKPDAGEGDADKPADDSAGDGAKPSDEEKPADEEKPTDEKKPADEEKPADEGGG